MSNYYPCIIGTVRDDKSILGGRSATGIAANGLRYRVSIDCGQRVLIAGGRFGRKFGFQWRLNIMCVEPGHESKWIYLGTVKRSQSILSVLKNITGKEK
jgi:hypothetical protein